MDRETGGSFYCWGGVASIVIMVMMAGRIGLRVGAKAMVARFVGAGDVRGANHAVMQALVTCGIYVTVMAIMGISFAKPILILMGLEADVVDEGAAYMCIQFVSLSVMGLWMITERIIQASGDTMIPLRIAVLFRAIHLALSPLLVFGWWNIPATRCQGGSYGKPSCLHCGGGHWIVGSLYRADPIAAELERLSP